MGCQQLTYHFETPPLKVPEVSGQAVYRTAAAERKSVQRFLSVDPMSDEAPGWTPYRYGFQNPVKYVDPRGLLELETSGDPQKKSPTQPGLDGIGYKSPQNTPQDNTPPVGSHPQDAVAVAPTLINPSNGAQTGSLSLEKLAYADPVAAMIAACEMATENRSISNYLGKFRGVSGPIIDVIGVAMVLSDYQKTKLPQGNPNRMSNNQFAYGLAAFGVSTLTAVVVGGAPGAVAGTSVAGMFWAGEQFYNAINWGIGEISKGVSDFENALNQGWVPNRF